MHFVRAASLTGYAEVARSVGLDPNRILRRVEIDPARLADPENRLPARAVGNLLELSAAESGCRHFALLLAERRSLATLGPLSLLIRELETQRAVLDAFIRYQRVLTDAASFTVDEQGESTLVHTQLLIELDHEEVQGIELAMAAVSRVMISLAGERGQPESAHFLHKAPADLTAHKREFRCPLHFESVFNGFVYSTRTLDSAISRTDVKAHRYAEEYLETLRQAVEKISTADRIRAALRFLLPMGRGTLEQTSRHLGTHLRMLQRSLQEDGLTFGQILNETRRMACLSHLRDSNHSVQAISSLLGFASASSFARWFQGEFGKSPSRWRADQDGEIPPAESLSDPNTLPATSSSHQAAWGAAQRRSAAARRRVMLNALRSRPPLS